MVGMVKRASVGDTVSLGGDVEGGTKGAVGLTGVWKMGDTDF